MLSNTLLSLALLWISKWLACDYEPYKTLQEMQNIFICLQRISHKLEASLEFTRCPSEPVIRSTAFCWERCKYIVQQRTAAGEQGSTVLQHQNWSW